MATLKIGDKRVTVGDEFLSLPPDQQQATVDEIAKSLGVSAQPEQPAAPAQQVAQPSWGDTAMDVLKSAGSGVVEGAVGLATMPQDIGSWIGEKATGGIDRLLGYTPEQIAQSRAQAGRQMQTGIQPPSGQQVMQGVESVIPMHQPETTAGRYAKTTGQFAAGALAGPGGVMRKAALTVVPGMASEAAGQATEGTAFEPYARLGGAVVGGIAAASKPGAAVKQMREGAGDMAQVTAAKDQAYKALDDAKIIFEPTAYKSTAMKIQMDLRKHGLLPEQGGPEAGLLNMVTERARTGKINGWTEVDSLRQDAGAIAYGGKATEQEAARAKIIRKHLDDLIENGKVMSLRGVARDQIKPMVANARELARRTIIARDISQMTDRSKWYVSGDESGLRNQFSSYGKKRGQSLTDAEQKAFQKVLSREGVMSAVNSAGGKLGQIILGGVGYGSGGLPGAALALGGHFVARKGGEMATKKAVNDALKTVLAGTGSQKKALAGAKRLKGERRVQGLLATDSGRRSAEPLLMDAQGNVYPYSLLGQ